MQYSQSSYRDFSVSRPTRADADYHGQIYVYKPKGWPITLQPQYRHAPTHQLEPKGAWIAMKWNRLDSYSFTPPHWKQHLLYSHWLPFNHQDNGFYFDSGGHHHPVFTGEVTWSVIDWTPVILLVDQARELLLMPSQADPELVLDVDEQLRHWLEDDDPFYLHEWLHGFGRMHWFLARKNPGY